MDFRITSAHVAELKPHPKNYREHPDDQLDHICKSIEQHGFYRNIVVSKDNYILAGHGVCKGAARLGFDVVPVVELDVDHDSPGALKLLAGDNEIGKFAEVDDRALSDLLKDIHELDIDGLMGTGFDEMMLANLVIATRTADEIEDFDAAAEWVGMPEYEPEPDKFKLMMFFDSTEEREKFCEANKIKTSKKFRKTWSAWWPPRERQDQNSVEWE
jgi:hypothetical protein